jgi:hypothetical protein
LVFGIEPLLILLVVRLRCLFWGENSLNVEGKGRRGGDLTIILGTRPRLGNFGVGEFPFGAGFGAADNEDVLIGARSLQNFTART